jgi:hypothetical protein
LMAGEMADSLPRPSQNPPMNPPTNAVLAQLSNAVGGNGGNGGFSNPEVASELGDPVAIGADEEAV